MDTWHDGTFDVIMMLSENIHTCHHIHRFVRTFLVQKIKPNLDQTPCTTDKIERRKKDGVPTSLLTMAPTIAPMFKPTGYHSPDPRNLWQHQAQTSNFSVKFDIAFEMPSAEGSQIDCVETPCLTRSKDYLLDVRNRYYIFNNGVDEILTGLGQKRGGQIKICMRSWNQERDILFLTPYSRYKKLLQ